jgi:hypothetical protein
MNKLSSLEGGPKVGDTLISFNFGGHRWSQAYYLSILEYKVG